MKIAPLALIFLILSGCYSDGPDSELNVWRGERTTDHGVVKWAVGSELTCVATCLVDQLVITSRRCAENTDVLFSGSADRALTPIEVGLDLDQQNDLSLIQIDEGICTSQYLPGPHTDAMKFLIVGYGLDGSDTAVDPNDTLGIRRVGEIPGNRISEYEADDNYLIQYFDEEHGFPNHGDVGAPLLGVDAAGKIHIVGVFSRLIDGEFAALYRKTYQR